MKPTFEQTIRIHAGIENLSTFREFIKKHCDAAKVAEDILFDLMFVVDEACTNIITHGYIGATPDEIALTLVIDANRVMITIADHGRAFDPDTTQKPDINGRWQDRKIGGLGWHLIKDMTDTATYTSDPERGNRLVLVKKINEGPV